MKYLTAKEKAKEIYEKFYNIYVNDEDEHYIGTIQRFCIQQSLLLVNEILEATLDYFDENHSLVTYYQQVKKEIINYKF